MRSEADMFKLIVGTAQEDERVRAVYMNGSRTNPNAPRDTFQDYDIVYVVKETASFLRDPDWIRRFGELRMVQEPDGLDALLGKNVDTASSYGYLMLFMDGNRIDLHLRTIADMQDTYLADKLTLPLLDKDGCLPAIPPPSDQDYWVKQPTEPLYAHCCNEFWWCMQNVAKGLARDELPYAKDMFETVIRDMLNQMAGWWIGMDQGFRLSIGKKGKYLKRYLPPAYWTQYERTYADGNTENAWQAVFAACELFRAMGEEIAERFGFRYSIEDDRLMTAYLEQVRDMGSTIQERIV
ncbi:aminoglycoside 6-adenylyltransferase [Paenibacillus sp. R14(2021)]|uniref:aminoglycoside 6-adenylyltransferase n=1 Tax=Paenibacillus sp. R14(2021) TaxID=2859228 RepID=UPI001C6150A8|nr:aminoglycoside 6-adenylyltransferase [Paenibacillus sp. R14(2021)]